MVAIASTIEAGTRWVMKSLRLNAAFSSPLPAVVGGSARPMPTPGWSRLTSTSPSDSEIRLAKMNQASARPPTRPSAVTSPMWAMPTTKVENTNGAMIILISRRNSAVTIEK